MPGTKAAYGATRWKATVPVPAEGAQRLCDFLQLLRLPSDITRNDWDEGVGHMYIPPMAHGSECTTVPAPPRPGMYHCPERPSWNVPLSWNVPPQYRSGPSSP
eukprot:2945680-Rhodomonas_salina.1